MLRNKIIAEFWESKSVNEAFEKMQPVELQADLKSEVFLILCEMEEEKLIGLYQRNELKYYMVRIMLNMIKSDRSNFFKNYRNYTELFENDQEVPIVESDPEESYQKIELHLQNLHWYNRELFKLYALDFKKNAKELSRKTGIPYMSIVRSINKTKAEIKKNIKK
jgi:hypothetical protein